MSSIKNLALVFAKIPTAFPIPGEHLVLKDLTFNPFAPPPPGGLTLEHLYASFDPYMRGRMRDPSIKTYFPAFEIGQPLSNAGMARVLKSNNPNYTPGDIILGTLPFQQYSTHSGSFTTNQGRTLNLRKLDVENGVPDERDYLGALGLAGRTAYCSLYEIGDPKRGETIFISSAAGAVGALVGQIAKHEGLRVIGSVGSQEKLDMILTKLGFDGGFNYKTEKPADALRRLAPDGIDIYYDNVGGEQLEAALDKANDYAKVVCSGMISQYNLPYEEKWGLKNLMQIVFKKLTMRGFVVSDPDIAGKWGEQHETVMTGWLKKRSIRSLNDETVGMEKAAEGLVRMLKGQNFGKAVLKIKE